jgi:hypothetical protein
MAASKTHFILLAVLSAVGIGSLLFYERGQEARVRSLQRAVQALLVQNRALASAVPNDAVVGLVREMAAHRTRPEYAGSSSRDLQLGLRPISSLSYAGNETPLAAIESCLWAIYHGDVDRLATLIAFTPDGESAAAALFANLPADAKARFQNPESMIALLVAYAFNAVGYQILASSEKGGDPSTRTVQALLQLEDGRTSRPNVTLQNTKGNWQVQFDENAVRQFATVFGAADASKSADRRGAR